MLVDFKDIAAPRVEGDFVVRQGKFFEIGDFADKQFSLNEVEADAAIQRFTPAPLNIEHMPTIFDGKLGDVRKLWRDGKDINAEYAIPKWLHDVTQAEPIKISSEWNRAEKTAVGGALVLNPRVKDAAMMAAFSAVEGVDFGSKRDSDKMQRVHDMMCDMGAECGGKSYFAEYGIAAFLGPDELKTVQKLHDLTATFDDCCNRYQSRNQMYSYYSDSQAHPQDAGKGKKSMFEGIKAAFARLGVPKEEVDTLLAQETPKPAEPAKVEMSADDKATFAAMQQTLAATQTQLNEQKAQFAEQQAEAQFTKDSQALHSLVRQFRVTSAELDGEDGLLALAKTKPASFAHILPTLQKRPVLPMLSGDVVRGHASADAARLKQLAEQRAKEKGVTYQVAFSEICTENKELAQSVRMAAQEGN